MVSTLCILHIIVFCYLVTTSDSIEFKPLPSYIITDSSINITCQIDIRHLVFFDTDIHVKIKHSVSSLSYSVMSPSNGGAASYLFDHTLTNLKLSESGEYTCVYYRTTSNPFITIEPINITTVTTLTVQSKLSLYLTVFTCVFIQLLIISFHLLSLIQTKLCMMLEIVLLSTVLLPIQNHHPLM